ncbi:MAG TPA: bifunctional phosphoglucose/phosphomannose isomerase [Candidatus Kapabacteria bacterium]|jgi:glucose/mannose-6-phosphate isomerase|nr:bifunctional phosphoglucose/phosphomannose isomerase [Candidatus Kapabacteria bacterium]HOM05233.1 bifunctional phosphoglucose/phosphomannose isomerase [Candidatus Kapabacteria bacterium]HOQ49140.1 bifunctional phosphoglucose/phosphomannose isomerase [Candidatus Kapabacteria bacterium]HPP40067.1 bifunctional phosphoglucose/phosphomannose isomerase [Candidatus Kapabacteria bacterium]HPU23477.1 bifunctional phosphoglucose/phosphomannose isomerase [Candidatus Kapabacteria bacterium]
MIENLDDLRKFDSDSMFQVLLDFPKQISEAIKIIENSETFQKIDYIPTKFLILGMGGSAIGGDLLRSFCKSVKGANHLQIIVNRNYEIPAFIDESWFVIASSYSGGTEETIAAYNFAKSRTNNILAITSGGKLEELARKDGYPVINIPSGFMPRCALGYSFFTLLLLLIRMKAIENTIANTILSNIQTTKELLIEKSKIYSDVSDNNLSISIANKVKGKIPVIYSSENILDVVNLRWRGQIQENSKNLAFGNFLPEMNHNEINSWIEPSSLINQFVFILLRDKDDIPQISKRIEAIKQIFADMGNEVIELQSGADSLLERIFDLIYLGDWVSYWLALLNRQDPTPIPLISKMKEILSKS